MRKKIGKRIGPVPVLLAVAAIAVFTAFVAIQANAAFAQEQIAKDKGCGVIFDAAIPDAGAGNAAAIKERDCTTTADELSVTFKLVDLASGTAVSSDLYVYRIGGNVGSMRAQMPYGFGEAGTDAVGEDDYNDPPLSTVTPDDPAIPLELMRMSLLIIP